MRFYSNVLLTRSITTSAKDNISKNERNVWRNVVRMLILNNLKVQEVFMFFVFLFACIYRQLLPAARNRVIPTKLCHSCRD